MADIKLEDLDGGENLDAAAMKGIYGGVGAQDAPGSPPLAGDPNQPPTVPVVPLGPDGALPGEGAAGNGGGGGGGNCQL